MRQRTAGAAAILAEPAGTVEAGTASAISESRIVRAETTAAHSAAVVRAEEMLAPVSRVAPPASEEDRVAAVVEDVAVGAAAADGDSTGKS